MVVGWRRYRLCSISHNLFIEPGTKSIQPSAHYQTHQHRRTHQDRLPIAQSRERINRRSEKNSIHPAAMTSPMIMIQFVSGLRGALKSRTFQQFCHNYIKVYAASSPYKNQQQRRRQQQDRRPKKSTKQTDNYVDNGRGVDKTTSNTYPPPTK